MDKNNRVKIEKQIEELLKSLEKSKKIHLEIAEEMLKADQGNIYPLDLLRSVLLKDHLCWWMVFVL